MGLALTLRNVIILTSSGLILWFLCSIYLFEAESNIYNQANELPNDGHINILKINSSTNISSSMHTVPSLFLISVPKSGSSSLIKWLVNTHQIFGDVKLGPKQVENNVLWVNYINEMVDRKEGNFDLSDDKIATFNDYEYLKMFTQKPPNSTKKHRPKKFKRTEELFPSIQNEQRRTDLMEKQKWHTVAKSVFYLHLPYMSRVFAAKYANTKILITVRNPIDRLKSNYLFFIGEERKRLTNLYGNVNLYLEHVTNHKLLAKPFEEIKGNLSVINELNGTISNMEQWTHIFSSYHDFLLNVIKVCREDFEKMSFKQQRIDQICTEKDLIRNALGISCYIVPIMQWFMTNSNPMRNFRLLQSEIMFQNPNEYISKILCWVQMDHDGADCNGWEDKEWNAEQTQWRKSKSGFEDVSDDVRNKIMSELSQCNLALDQFVNHYEFVKLAPFDLSLWE